MSIQFQQVGSDHEASNAPQMDDVIPPMMAPFNLEQALAGAPICTREGSPAVLVRLDETAPPDFRLKVKLPEYDYPRTYGLNGRYYSDGRTETIDLFMRIEATAAMPQPSAVSLAA